MAPIVSAPSCTINAVCDALLRFAAGTDGPAEANAGLREAIRASEPTSFEDQRIRTHWVLEKGDPRHAWINQAIFVSDGRFAPPEPESAGFEHRVCRVG